ncbi:hypothetical protein [Thiocystis violacea]|uniref:hypothetical protein n=1 Tax=Thiocystis violacea TaxID=13725 RepID=UPI0019083D25|nr:hypothetical protein [Thiocystis violacea]MBK1716892.1 hypothetical protein [Thiocystis violacea]
MRLTDHDLRQLDEARLHGLPGTALRELSKRLFADLKEARERLNRAKRGRIREKGTREKGTHLFFGEPAHHEKADQCNGGCSRWASS